MSPREAARKNCVSCVDGKDFRSNTCDGRLLGSSGPTCRLYGVTHSNAPGVLKAIRKECLCCMGHIDSDGGSGRNVAIGMVENCRSTKCALHDFRFGKNPNLAGRAPRGFLARPREE